MGYKASFKHRITRNDVENFVSLTGDDNKLHVDTKYAEKTEYKGIVVHGMLGASYISTLVGKYIPGDGALWLSQSIEFLNPIRIDDELLISAEVVSTNNSLRILSLKIEISNQNRQVLVKGASKVKVLEIEEPEAPDEEANLERTVIVTGASRGIGAAIAEKLAAEGYQVIVNYRSDQSGAEQVLERIYASGGKALGYKADITSQTDVEKLVRFACDKFGGISSLVNNATGKLIPQSFESLSSEDLLTHLNISYIGVFGLIKECLPHLGESRNGSVVNLGTINTDNTPAKDLIPYTAAKAAMESLTKSLAVEYGPKGIRFNLVAPGMTDTALIADTPTKARLLTKMNTPLRRLAKPADIANSVSFLLSDSARHITGETLRVCGGYTMV